MEPRRPGPVLAVVDPASGGGEETLRQAAAAARMRRCPLEICARREGSTQRVLAEALRLRARLIVLGGGETAGSDLNLRMARAAPCPVLIARVSPAGDVLVAVRLSKRSEATLVAGLAEAAWRGVGLVALHVVRRGRFGLDRRLGRVLGALGVPPRRPLLSPMEALQSTLRRLTVNAEAEVRRGDPFREVLAGADEMRVSLVVVGASSWLNRLTSGEGEAALFRTAPCSVLVARRLADPATLSPVGKESACFRLERAEAATGPNLARGALFPSRRWPRP